MAFDFFRTIFLMVVTESRVAKSGRSALRSGGVDMFTAFC